MRSRLVRGAALAMMASALLATFPLEAGATATPLSSGVAWLTDKVHSGGYVATSGTTPDLGSTAEVAMALHAATGNTATVTSMLSYLAAHEGAYIDGTAGASPTNDDAGSLAELILLAHATGTQTQFGSAALVTRLEATQSTLSPGLFGAADPTYNGTIRQSLALEALSVSNVSLASSPITSGITWLEAQQCSNGGFSADAAATGFTGCTSSQYAGPDSNSTADALMALGALGRSHDSAVPSALSFLSSMERPHGAFGYLPGNGGDADSTSDVIMGLRAVGQSPGSKANRWTRGGVAPTTALLTFQVKAPGSSVGGFRWQMTSMSPNPDIVSSEQAVLALTGELPTA